MLGLWTVLFFVGALPAVLVTGMAFEGGSTFGAVYSLAVMWLYPILLGVAYAYRRSKPALVWLPLIPIALMLLSMATSWPASV